MDVNPDFRDLLLALRNEGARYLVVGAYAVIYHTEPRYTKDLDLWVEPTPENAERIWRALAKFGAPLERVDQADFANERLVFSMGIEPNRIDILMGIEGLTFSRAWKRRIRSSYGGVPVCVLGKADLIKAKLAAGRPADLLDVASLRKRRMAGRRRRRMKR
jgi:hypothetical protein